MRVELAACRVLSEREKQRAVTCGTAGGQVGVLVVGCKSFRSFTIVENSLGSYQIVAKPKGILYSSAA